MTDTTEIKPKHAGGRPSEYTQTIADEICARLACGESLRTVCKDEHLPCTSTIFSWFRVYPEFLQQYTRAKEESADAMAEEVIDIADNATNDYMERLDKDGQAASWAFNGEHVQRSRLRVDTRKWLMAKMKPKKYGEKVDAQISGDLKITWDK
jgi:hypothetical protein